jgi:hypothetical protein
MNFGQLLAVVVTNALLNGRSKTLTWKTVQTWINQNNNPNITNRGFALNSWTGSGASNAFVELHKDVSGNKTCRVTAKVYFNKRQGAAASKTWEVSKLDSELEKMFGKNLRMTIQI